MKKFLVLMAFVAVAVVAFYAGDQHGMNESMDHEDMEHMGIDGHDPRVSAGYEMIAGTWSSEDDRNFIREYKKDGTVIDNYATASGEVITSANWSIFTADTAPEGVEFQLNNKDIYITQTEKDGSVTYFRVDTVTPSELGLINMTKGGGIRFGKMTTGHEMQDGEEVMEISASFRCDDESSFVADFSSSMDEVTISSEGEENTFPQVASTSGKKYENTLWSFVFRGETATVTNKQTSKSTTCNPPLDPNNAPFNFGD